MKGTIDRLVHEHEQTLGRFHLYDGEKEVFSCATLELPNRENKTNVSRIPEGKYEVVKRWSQKFGDHLHILDVKDRSYILIHIGNYYTDIEGCILFGDDFSDINKDGYKDVTSSGDTLDELLDILEDRFELTIKDI